MTDDQVELLIALTTDWHMKAERVRVCQMDPEGVLGGEVGLKQAIHLQLAATEERLAFNRLKLAEAEIIEALRKTEGAA